MRTRNTVLMAASMALACAPHRLAVPLAGFTPIPATGERIRVLELYPGVIATMVAPTNLDPHKRIDLILYALPNGNSTPETMGRTRGDNIAWRFDIQHIAAQTRALRTRGMHQAVVVYLEADTKSWPEWRRTLGYDRANARIVSIVDQLTIALNHPQPLAVTLAGHSGGGSFIWGFIEGQKALPPWLERIVFLDANYSFETQHGPKITEWLRRDPRHTLVVMAYDDREIMLDGKKVVSDSGGTWRASQRMMTYFTASSVVLTADSTGDFLRFRAPQMEFLLHPNPANRILHTELVGEMNGYMHALLVMRPEFARGDSVLKPLRAYEKFIDTGATLPTATPPDIPERAANARTGSAFIASLELLSRDERELAIRRELLAGNIPSFLRTVQTVHATATGANGVNHSIAYDVMPDYLAIGSDSDYVRMPMSPYIAQDFCDAYGYVLPTRKMVNDIWKAAPIHLEPRPLIEARESPRTFLQHQHIIAEQLGRVQFDAPNGQILVAGIKKDVVVTNKLLERPNRVAIYGWHHENGEPIQPLYTGHVDWYVDYSHGIRPVRRWMRVDGVRRPYERILADTTLQALISDEGVIGRPRYDRYQPE